MDWTLEPSKNSGVQTPCPASFVPDLGSPHQHISDLRSLGDQITIELHVVIFWSQPRITQNVRFTGACTVLGPSTMCKILDCFRSALAGPAIAWPEAPSEFQQHPKNGTPCLTSWNPSGKMSFGCVLKIGSFPFLVVWPRKSWSTNGFWWFAQNVV